MNIHHFPIHHSPIGLSNGSRVLCVRKQTASLTYKARGLILVLTGLMKSLCPVKKAYVPRQRRYFQQASRNHIPEDSLFQTNTIWKNRKRTPVTCRVTENDRFQETCTVSSLLIDENHNVDKFTRTVVKALGCLSARYSRPTERILIIFNMVKFY
jgi:hypothetical protein